MLDGKSRLILIGVVPIVIILIWFISTTQRRILTFPDHSNVTLKVTVADDESERSRGLSGRENLLPNEGMLFVFDTVGQPGFWMKGMKFPIDIIWVGPDLKIVGFAENLRPESYPTIFTPPKPIKMAIETSVGFSQKNNLRLGDRIQEKVY